MSNTSVATLTDRTILEFDRIVEATLRMCASQMGREQIETRLPTIDPEIIDRWREELHEMLQLLRSDEFPSLRLPDIRPLLDKAARSGSFLDAVEFLQVGEFLSGVDALLKFAKVSEAECPRLEAYLEHLSAAYQLRVAIERAIAPEGYVSDGASPELLRIRREKRRVRDRIVSRLERILAGRTTDPERTDDIITLRNDRFVIPIREGDPAASDGVIQDRSSSGATLFVEPMGVVEMNNSLRRLGMEEAREVERILLELSDLLRDHRRAIAENAKIVGALDGISAVARFAIRTDAVVAERVDTASLKLIEARHPLLVLKALRQPAEERDTVVPLSVTLGDNPSTLIVTGPNTGGKTVALKTVGLLTLMAQAGWPIPAQEGSTIGLFHRVLADIGDEQSIDSSLSTFSSHLTRIGAALRFAERKTLVLLDELGAGTDPKEGAALGESIIRELTDRGARLVVTTHHSALKTLSQHDQRIENASLVFDTETLAPSYQFRVGVPGASYAIDIARRLGIPDRVVDRAAALLGEQEKDLTNLLKELDERLASVKQREDEVGRHRDAAAELESLFRARLEKLEATESERKTEALAEAERIITDTRREMENLVRSIRETQAEKGRVKSAHKEISERLERVHQTKSKVAPQPPAPVDTGPLAVGDTIWIEAFNREGEVVSLDHDRGKLKARIGDFLYNLDRAAVRKLARGKSEDKPRPKTRIPNYSMPDVGAEIMLRGFSVDEALEKLDRYLDDARLVGLKEVRVVHGRGEGILRRAVTDYLGRDARVATRRLGHWNEGADGVTITTLNPL